MRIILLFLSVITFLQPGFSQNPASIKKIEFAVYRYNSFLSEVKDQAEIEYYCIIDEKGLVKAQDMDNPDKTLEVVLTDSTWKKTRRFFSGKKLNSHKTKQIPQGLHYASLAYHYISITYADKTKQSLCYVGNLMSDEFNDLMDQLINTELTKEGREIDKKLITPELTKTITALHQKSRDLPKVEQPPPEGN